MAIESENSENNETVTEQSRPIFHVHVTDDDDDNTNVVQNLNATNNDNSTSSDPAFDKLFNSWLEFENEIRTFEPKHKEYVHQIDQVENLKTEYAITLSKYQKKLDQMKKQVAALEKLSFYNNRNTESDNENSSFLKPRTGHMKESLTASNTPRGSHEDLHQLPNSLAPAERMKNLVERIQINSIYLNHVADTIPRKDSYLRVILGSVNVSILNKAEKLKYKQEYEKFKFIITCISFVSSILIWSLTSRLRAFDALFHFLLVWYYCTLTIRESILVVNGSNIHPWWRAHHFISTVATGILLTWPDSTSYHSFRTPFFLFSFYLSFVQGLQFYYQSGCLYRLRALGETNDMEVTIEGFQKWMFRGLSFLVPFLLLGYIFQFSISLFLWSLSRHPTTHEWQVFVLSMIFLILSLGNFLTTWIVLREKFYEKRPGKLLRQHYLQIRHLLATSSLYKSISSRRHRNSISNPELHIKLS